MGRIGRPPMAVPAIVRATSGEVSAPRGRRRVVEAPPKVVSDGGDVSSEEASCEDSDASSGSTAPSLNVKTRGRRTTAGCNEVVRDTKAKEDHETFWNHEAFQEGSSTDSDVKFDSSVLSEAEDSSDSDIDKEEAAPASDEGEESEEAKAPRRRHLPLPVPGAGRGWGRGRGRGSGRGGAPESADLEARASAREKSVAAAEAAALRTRKGSTRMTQQQRLEEAAQTEELNLAELRNRRNSEDAAKPLAQGFRRKRYEGPRVRLVSRQALPTETCRALIGSRLGAVNTVDFINCGLPEVLVQGPPEVQQHKRFRVALTEPDSFWFL